MTDLYAYAPPFGAAVIRAWLLPLGAPVATDRKPNDPLPQRIIRRINGPVDRISDHGLYSVHDFAAKATDAETASQTTFRRMALLGPPFSGQSPIEFDGDTYFCDGIDVDEYPHEEDYSDTVKRYVGTYRVHFRFVPA
jgi:hypothetical protein